MMSQAEIRLKQNQVLTSILLGLGQGDLVAQRLFPRLPQFLSGAGLIKIGDDRLRKYKLRRAPGARTARVDIGYEGKFYSVNQHSIEVPVAREFIRESTELNRIDPGAYPDLSRLAMVTANAILLLDYEMEVADLALSPAAYASSHVVALAGPTKWSKETSSPVTDIRSASESIRKKVGRRPNLLMLSAQAYAAISCNLEVMIYSGYAVGPATPEMLKLILGLDEIVIGDAIWESSDGTKMDVWGNNAILAYVPKIVAAAEDFSLADPAFGFTSALEGHPFAENPYYSAGEKSWIFGATYERQPYTFCNEAAFLFQNPL